MRYRRLLSLLLSLSASSLVKGQKPSGLPSEPKLARIAVVALDSGMHRTSDAIADLTRAELQRLTSREQLDVISNYVVNHVLLQEEKAHVAHHDYREMAKLIRAIAIVDVVVLGRSPTVTVRAIAHYLSKAGPDTLPLFVGRNDTAVALRLARHLLRATIPRARTELPVYEGEQARRGCTAGPTPYFEFQVDTAASFVGSDGTLPRPSSTAAQGARGPGPTFLVQFVVDTSGRALPGTLKFLTAPSRAAADSARAAIDRWRFRPAMLTRCKVSQMVQVELER
jgi:hypothetical protein